ncbi:membrane protein [Methylobacterium variabile]|jgi:ABC-2 type transport system permease protein|uniref:Membrane protein n=1 Tax=Methylobacterium variabile TaxID=298794 RepID=A0A0J6SL86_9HYPH|nr:ABC transporter permease [Methylobacterium variabile]KMO34392.1 membrane protein [Methylobacterium variabile]
MAGPAQGLPAAPAPSGLATHAANVLRLVVKELRSIRADPVMLFLVVYAFSFAVQSVASGASTEVRDLTVGVVDEDRSDLSRQIVSAFTPPLFKQVVPITPAEVDPAMDSGRLVFVIDLPPRLQRDVLSARPTSVQVNVDATAMTQAGNGSVYIQTIIAQEVANFAARSDLSAAAPVRVVTRAMFNPNLQTSWFTSVMQVINNITLLTVILTGAALIREREQGTVEHLLVMPLVPVEIMLAKVVANGLVILVAAGLSLVFVVEGWLGVPIAGSIPLFLLGAGLYALAVAALGILLGTIATSMGQFGLLVIPILLLMQLLSGSSTPMESMPVWLQIVVQTLSPTPHFVALAQAVLYRGAGLPIIWPQLLALAALGSVYFAFALARFRRVIFGD